MLGATGGRERHPAGTHLGALPQGCRRHASACGGPPASRSAPSPPPGRLIEEWLPAQSGDGRRSPRVARRRSSGTVHGLPRPLPEAWVHEAEPGAVHAAYAGALLARRDPLPNSRASRRDQNNRRDPSVAAAVLRMHEGSCSMPQDPSGWDGRRTPGTGTTCSDRCRAPRRRPS